MEDNEIGRSFTEYEALAQKLEVSESNDEVEVQYWQIVESNNKMENL